VRDEEGNGWDKDVIAVAAGIVRYAGWARGGWSPYGKLVFIEHWYQNRRGEHFQTMYAHLHRVLVQEGQRVQAGTVIGTLGGSSKGQLRRYGPHLHFALYKGSGKFWRFGGGQAVVPEPLGQFEDLRHGMTLNACGQPDDRHIVFFPKAKPPVGAFGGLADPPQPPPHRLQRSFPLKIQRNKDR
jgi:murein DD-endopeptidase MepM/ murein hydrolase activator NlpD